MPEIQRGRFMADTEQLHNGEVVVFLIGFRVNKVWKVRAWWQVFVAMPRMLRYLAKHPEQGLLAVRQGPTVIVQYWRSFEDLERFARNTDAPHLAAWRAFNRRISDSGDVGIWHETYRVRAQDIEAIYGNMPAAGLSSITGLIPVQRGRDSAAARIGASQRDDPALPPY